MTQENTIIAYGRTPKRKLPSGALGLLVFVVNAAGCYVTLIFNFTSSMPRMETGALPSFIEKLSHWAFLVFSFPINTVMRWLPRGFAPGFYGWLIFAANSALWGFIASFIQSKRCRRQ